jgi:hypothetical protein
MDAKAIKELVRQQLGMNGDLIGVVIGEGLCIISVPEAVNEAQRAQITTSLYTQHRQIRSQFPVIRFI